MNNKKKWAISSDLYSDGEEDLPGASTTAVTAGRENHSQTMNQFWVREMPSGTCESGGGIPAPGQRGFTILELMVTIAIAAVLVSIAAPSFQSLISASRRDSAFSSLVDAIATARVEAVTRGVGVTLCATNDPGAVVPSCSGSNAWERGILVRQGGTVIQVWGKAPDGVTVRAIGFAQPSSVTFALDGTIASGGTLVVCDDDGADEAQAVVISVSGLSRIAVDDDGSGTIVDSHTGANVTCPAS